MGQQYQTKAGVAIAMWKGYWYFCALLIMPMAIFDCRLVIYWFKYSHTVYISDILRLAMLVAVVCYFHTLHEEGLNQ